MNIYTVYDVKAESYLQPFFAKNDAIARRMMESSMSIGDSMFSAHPEDFTVFRIGLFNEDTGVITPENKASPVCRVIELRAAPEEDAR